MLDLAGREDWQSVFFFVADGLPAADLPAAPLDDRLARGGDRPLRIVAYAIESERDDAPPLPARIQAACGAAKLDQDLRATPAAA